MFYRRDETLSSTDPPRTCFQCMKVGTGNDRLFDCSKTEIIKVGPSKFCVKLLGFIVSDVLPREITEYCRTDVMLSCLRVPETVFGPDCKLELDLSELNISKKEKATHEDLEKIKRKAAHSIVKTVKYNDVEIAVREIEVYKGTCCLLLLPSTI